MRIVARKLDPNMNGPYDFATVSEQELVNEGYVWDFDVFNDAGLCVRTGISKIKSEAKLRRYIESGMNRVEWEALHGKD